MGRLGVGTREEWWLMEGGGRKGGAHLTYFGYSRGLTKNGGVGEEEK